MAENILMVAYSIYTLDPRIIRESIAAQENGYNVDFIGLKKGKEPRSEVVNRINVIRTGQKKYRGKSRLLYILSYLEFFIRCFFRVTFLHLRRHYSIIHINNMPDFIVFTALIPKLMGAKVILDIHDPMPNMFLTKMAETKSALIYKLIKWQEVISAAFADAVVTVTEPAKRKLITYGVKAEDITVVANFADERHFKLKENYCIGDRIKLVYHGTIAERWGLKKILAALSRVENKERYYFKIIGDGDYSNEIREQIKGYGLTGIVDFDNQYYPYAQIPSMIKEYDLGVVSLNLSPATDYTLSTKMFEYLLTGIPVLTINNEGVRFYTCEKGCFFYDPDNLQTLIDILEKLASDNNILLSKREEIIPCMGKYTWTNEKNKYLRLLNELSKVNNGFQEEIA